MVVLSRKGKVTLLFSLLLVVFTLALATVIFSSIPFPSYQHGEGYVDPASAIHINSSGDILIPPFGSTNYKIERQGNTYILTGNVLNWLILEKSNIVLEGRGFTLGSQNGLSLSSVANVTVKDLSVKAHYLQLALQHAQNCTLLRTNSSYSIALSDSNNNLIDDCFGSIILERSSNNTIKDCLTGPIELNKSD